MVIQDLNEGLARSFGYSGTQGVVVGDVTPGGPADRAGIKPGDIIVRFDRRPVTNVATLRQMAADTPPGRRVPVEIFRDGKTRTVTVAVQEQEAPAAAQPSVGSENNGGLGLVLQTLTPSEGKDLGFPASFPGGVLIVDVVPLSPAEQANISPGEVVMSVQGEPVRSVSDFRRVLERHDPKLGVRLELSWKGGRRFAFVQAGGGGS